MAACNFFAELHLKVYCIKPQKPGRKSLVKAFIRQKNRITPEAAGILFMLPFLVKKNTIFLSSNCFRVSVRTIAFIFLWEQLLLFFLVAKKWCLQTAGVEICECAATLPSSLSYVLVHSHTLTHIRMLIRIVGSWNESSFLPKNVLFWGLPRLLLLGGGDLTGNACTHLPRIYHFLLSCCLPLTPHPPCQA